MDDFQKAISFLKREKNNRTDLVFWFASPLRPPVSSKSKDDLPLLNFLEEFSWIQKALKNTNKVVRYSKKVATASNFGDIFASNPCVLHFSGHGVKVHSDLRDNGDFNKNQEGDYLVIEDKYWSGQELSQKTIKYLLDTTKIDIEVAVVLSWHSEYIGRMFQKAGIHHVVCVGREYAIDDKACIAFAYNFYTKLFSNESTTVCQAFDFAKANVKTQFGKEDYAGEEHKFRCLHGHGRPRVSLYWHSN